MPKIVDHESRRIDLADAAARIMASQGLQNTTVRDIAREAGFTPGILRHYFRDKDDVIAHALRLLDERTAVRFRPSLSSDSALASVFEEGMPLNKATELDERVRIQFWARALSSPELSEQQTKSFKSGTAAMRALLRSRQREGDIDKDLKIEPVSEVMVALVVGASVLAVFLPKRSRRAFVRRIFETATRAIL